MGAAVDRLRELSGSIAGFTLLAGAAALLTPRARRRLGVPSWLLLLVASIAAAITVNELVGKPVPFLRWSFLTMMLRGRHLLREWQVGDGRETALEKYVVASTRPGDADDAIRVIDHFCRHVSYLINVGDQPAYRAHMRDNDGTLWHTTEHRTHAEYQSVIKDVVLESDYFGT
jgi:hypothetical protein